MKIHEAGEIISNSVYEWLETEVRTSGVDNTYLDDYDVSIAGLKEGYDSPLNYTAQKHEAHVFNRMPVWWETFTTTPPTDPAYDEQAAKIIFNSLMQVSGTYRIECYVQAHNAEDYLQRRLLRPVGFRLENLVNDRLTTHFLANGWDTEADFNDANLDLEKLDKRRQRAVKIGDETIKTLCARVKDGKDLGEENSKSVREMLDAQYNWVTFAVDCITFAAKIRKDQLGQVPFLEPKSIKADPKVIYPLAT